VFLCEIAEKKQDAMALLETTFTECSKPSDGDEEDSSDSHILLQMMRDNLAIWNKADGHQ
jgi:hypothetical protein